MGLFDNLFLDAKAQERDTLQRLYARASELYEQTKHLRSYLDTFSDTDTLIDHYLSGAPCVLDSTDSRRPAAHDFRDRCADILNYSNFYHLDASEEQLDTEDIEHASFLRQNLRDKITIWREGEIMQRRTHNALTRILELVLADLPDHTHGEESSSRAQSFSIPIMDFYDDPVLKIDGVFGVFLSEDIVNTPLYRPMRDVLHRNASFVQSEFRLRKDDYLPAPIDAKDKMDPHDIAHYFLRGTPLEDLFTLSVPFEIAQKARFEHMHVVGGSGHGKTQCLQHMIYHDIQNALNGEGGFAVIDSQGDLINTILHLDCFSPTAENSLADKVVLLDPNDIAYPLALNLFDMNLERIKQFSAVEQEKILNGTIELYEYIFGALLGAEMTQKQGVIFKYLARAMMAIPNADIHTLREFIEDGQPFRPYLNTLDTTSQKFFKTQFFASTYNDTRRQLLTRLWGILSNTIFEKMFSAPRNQVDLFDAMNQGKIVLINTAKDLLKTEGCSIFGRFFIALIQQAALSRSAIPVEQRTPFFVYIDECQDYLNESKVDDLLNQARKYNVGMVLAHQNLNQTDTKLGFFAQPQIW